MYGIPAKEPFTCDNCDTSASGVRNGPEVEDFTVHEQNGTTFTMCNGCERTYAETRKLVGDLNASLDLVGPPEPNFGS